MGSTFRIVMRSGPTPGKAFPLEKAETLIGRDLSNDVVINDPEISRRHSRIYIQNGSYVLEDLGSTNGTSVNGQRLIGPYSMRNGEVITLGERITFVFEAVQPGGAATLSASGPQSDLTAQPAAPAPVSPLSFSAPFNPAAYESPAAPQARPPAPQPRVQQPPAYNPPSSSYQPPQPAYPNPYQPVQQPAANPYPPAAQPVYPPPPPPQNQQMPSSGYEVEKAPFTGQVPIAPGIEPVETPARAPVWPYIVIGILLLIILVLVIDDFRLWCPLFGVCS